MIHNKRLKQSCRRESIKMRRQFEGWRNVRAKENQRVEWGELQYFSCWRAIVFAIREVMTLLVSASVATILSFPQFLVNSPLYC